MDVPAHSRAFSVATLADRWGCSGEKVRALILSGELASFRLGKLHRIRAQVVADYEGISLEALERSRSPTASTTPDPPPVRVSDVPATVDGVLLSMSKAGLPVDRVAVAADGGFTVYVATPKGGAKLPQTRSRAGGVVMTREVIAALASQIGK